PMITLQPQSQTISNGDSVVLSVAAIGTDPLVYQWERNGNDLAGATNTSLSLDNATPLNSGQYQVRVSNRVGVALSSPAALLVIGAPYISDLSPQFTDED